MWEREKESGGGEREREREEERMQKCVNGIVYEREGREREGKERGERKEMVTTWIRERERV